MKVNEQYVQKFMDKKDYYHVAIVITVLLAKQNGSFGILYYRILFFGLSIKRDLIVMIFVFYFNDVNYCSWYFFYKM